MAGAGREMTILQRSLNKLLDGQHIQSVITSADILMGVTFLICHKAVLEPTLCPMYARLCSHLSANLGSFPYGGEEWTFKRLLLNNCQATYELGSGKLREDIRQMSAQERMIKLRTLGIVRFIGELYKHRIVSCRIMHQIVQDLLGGDTGSSPADENVEVSCHLFVSVGKELDEGPKATQIIDIYFGRLKELMINPQVAPRLRFMIGNVVDLRANNWVPRHEEVNNHVSGSSAAGGVASASRRDQAPERKKYLFGEISKYLSG